MLNYKHILLATDLLDHEEDIVAKKAFEIGKASKAIVSIIHVIERVYPYTPTFLPSMVNIQEELTTTLKIKLQKLAAKLNIPPERQHLTYGQAKSLILQTADEIQADLIVVGSHGRHGLGALLGSTANGVLHGAKCDVLAVRIFNSHEVLV